MFKVNNKNTRVTPFSSVSTVDFEQVSMSEDQWHKMC